MQIRKWHQRTKKTSPSTNAIEIAATNLSLVFVDFKEKLYTSLFDIKMKSPSRDYSRVNLRPLLFFCVNVVNPGGSTTVAVYLGVADRRVAKKHVTVDRKFHFFRVQSRHVGLLKQDY